jgi:hypothetical protein
MYTQVHEEEIALSYVYEDSVKVKMVYVEIIHYLIF